MTEQKDLTEPVGWVRGTISVKSKDGTVAGGRKVVGFWSDNAPGLVVSEAVGSARLHGSWRVTHEATGFALSPEFNFATLAEACRVAEAIAPLTDWTAGKELLYARVDAQVKAKMIAAANAARNSS